MLSEKQTSEIRQDIESSSITIESLKEDLLDHFCCFIEEEMKWGSSFSIAYEKAKKQISPNGLDEIQTETLFLLNSKRIIAMKKILYVIGLASSMSVSLGFLFRIMHLPGADELTNYGLFVFALVFIPLLAITQYKNIFTKIISEKLRYIFLFVSAAMLAIGVILKLQRFADIGDVLVIISVLIFTFGFLPTQFFSMYKKSA